MHDRLGTRRCLDCTGVILVGSTDCLQCGGTNTRRLIVPAGVGAACTAPSIGRRPWAAAGILLAGLSMVALVAEFLL